MKIRCQNCGASIDTDKETKCSKCGTFYNRDIFREEQTGIKSSSNCNNPLHSNREMNEYLKNRPNATNNRVQYNNGKRTETCDYYERDGKRQVTIKRDYTHVGIGNSHLNKNNKGNKLVLGMIIFFFVIPFILPIIMAVFTFVAIFLNVGEAGGFVNIIEDQFVNGSDNTAIVTELNDSDIDNDDNNINYEVRNGEIIEVSRSLVDDQYFVGLEEYQEILDYEYAKDGFRYYKFRFQVENLTDEEIFSNSFSAISGNEDCARIHRDKDIFDEIEPYKMISGSRYLEDVMFEIPEENTDLEIIFNDNIKFKFYDFQ